MKGWRWAVDVFQGTLGLNELSDGTFAQIANGNVSMHSRKPPSSINQRIIKGFSMEVASGRLRDTSVQEGGEGWGQ
jgi:hypothetical protein